MLARFALPRDRRSRILALSLPIMGGMASQNLFNIVDTAMIGVLGPVSLAAVGIGSFVSFMSVALITGLSAGVQAMAARRLGEGRTFETAVALNGGLLLVLLIALPLTVGLMAAMPSLFPILNSDPQVIAEGVPYVEARLFAVVAVGMNFTFRGYWNGVNQSMLYLRTLLAMNAANILFNYVLIFGKFGFPELGAEGAGIGSALATFVGTGIYASLAWKRARPNGFLQGLPEWRTIKTMLRISLPSSIQQFLFASGLTAMFWIVGQVGVREVAAANVLSNLMLVAILPGLGLGLGAASLVGQALGRREHDDARAWGWDVVKVALVVMGLLGLPLLLMPQQLLAFFIHDAATIELATTPLRIVGGMVMFDAYGMVLMNALIGAGASRIAMTVSVVTQWGLFLPAAWLVGPVLGYGLTGIWICSAAHRLIQAGVLALIWRSDRWTGVKV